MKTVMGQLRTMRAALERKLACNIPLDHPVMARMTTHAAQLLSRFQVGHDGHTPHERVRGKPFKVALPEFGETGWRHLPVKLCLEKATFLGLTPMTNEFYLWETTTADAAPLHAILEDREPRDPTSTVPQATPQTRDLYLRKRKMKRWQGK